MLEIKKLRKNFGKKKVLKGVNLKIEKDEIVGIIGPSGCGKSTLLRSINFLEIPTSGEIYFKGEKINKDDNLSLIRQKIGIVFQQFNLFNNLNVLDNITLAPIKLGIMNKIEARVEAEKLLKVIQLEEKINEMPASLSGGQMQRIAIIRALMMKPDLMLFDEPTSALDPEMIGEVEELIKSITKNGMTSIIVSHDLNFLKEITTRMLFMVDGEIVEDAPTEKFFDNPQDERLKEFLKVFKTND